MYTLNEIFDLEELVSEKEKMVEESTETNSENKIESNEAPIKSKYF